MPLMPWNEKLSVGVAAIDNEHKKLVAFVNEIYDAMQAGKAQDVLAPVVDGLVAYTESHFRREEELLASIAYPSSAEHSREHAALARQVLELQAKVRTGVDGALLLEVLNVLKTWLINHIQGSDRKYIPYIEAAGIK